MSDLRDWNSRFIGAGPRVTLTGNIPIVGQWSFDYSGGIAGLIGDRSMDSSVVYTLGPSFALLPPNISTSHDTLAFIFNADAWVALTYFVGPGLKASGGIRGDYYNSASTTYNVNTGGLQNIDRLYWGPFIRLTGLF